MQSTERHIHGHRQRLRRRFLEKPDSLSEVEALELLLTYAIPRIDVKPIAERLIQTFGSLNKIFHSTSDDLESIAGIGENASLLIRVIGFIKIENNSLPNEADLLPPTTSEQPTLFELESEEEDQEVIDKQSELLRVFVNDEIDNSLTFLPQVLDFDSFLDLKVYLAEKLPYNSASTRKRRAGYILDRFFPNNTINTPLAFFAYHCGSQLDLRPVVFYHVLQAEPMAAKIAEEFIWPALPVGWIDREDLRAFILQYLPNIGASSQKNMLRSIFTTYELLGVGVQEKNKLRLKFHKGTLEGFLYILTDLFSQPGIYDFDSLENGPMRKWLLWDREWMRHQLYNLQDLGILAKVSEIDTVRQFSLICSQKQALEMYFKHPERHTLAIREPSNNNL